MKTAAVMGPLLGLLAILLETYLYHGHSQHLASQNLKELSISVHYQQYYALLITLLSLLLRLPLSRVVARRLRLSAYGFIMGTVLFCTSIDGHYLAHITFAMPVTPIGGTLLIISWLLLLSIAWIPQPPQPKETS